MFATSGTYPWSFVTKIFYNGQPSHGGDRKTIEALTSTYLRGIIGSVAVASLLAATLYQGNLDRNQTLWNIVTTEKYIFHIQVLLELNLVCGHHFENSKAVHRRKTDNAMAKRKRTKGLKQLNVKNGTQKTTNRATRTKPKIGAELKCSRGACSICVVSVMVLYLHTR